MPNFNKSKGFKLSGNPFQKNFSSAMKQSDVPMYDRGHNEQFFNLMNKYEDRARDTAMERFYDELGYTEHGSQSNKPLSNVADVYSDYDGDIRYITGGADQHHRDKANIETYNRWHSDGGNIYNESPSTEYSTNNTERMDQYRQLVEDIKYGRPGAQDAMDAFVRQDYQGGTSWGDGAEKQHFDQDMANIRVAESDRLGNTAAEKSRTSEIEDEMARRTNIAQSMANTKAAAEYEADAIAAAKGKEGSKKHDKSIAEYKANNPLELPYEGAEDPRLPGTIKRGHDKFHHSTNPLTDDTYSTSQSGNLIDMLSEFGSSPEKTPMEKSGFKMKGSHHYGKKKKV
tara:strand:+ start:380 stop:1405 length:1026 start_codon:yes stop_codon:yes gene_type:complete